MARESEGGCTGAVSSGGRSKRGLGCEGVRYGRIWGGADQYFWAWRLTEPGATLTIFNQERKTSTRGRASLSPFFGKCKAYNFTSYSLVRKGYAEFQKKNLLLFPSFVIDGNAEFQQFTFYFLHPFLLREMRRKCRVSFFSPSIPLEMQNFRFSASIPFIRFWQRKCKIS